MNILEIPVFHDNKCYRYILCVTFFQFVSPHHQFCELYFCNHCKYMIVYQKKLYVCLFHSTHKKNMCV